MAEEKAAPKKEKKAAAVDAAELVLRQRLQVELGNVAIDDRSHVRRLVEKCPVGLEQRQVGLLPFDRALHRHLFGRHVLGGIFERVDGHEHDDAGADQEDVE